MLIHDFVNTVDTHLFENTYLYYDIDVPQLELYC